jgi:outer membrane immunogenic protein
MYRCTQTSAEYLHNNWLGQVRASESGVTGDGGIMMRSIITLAFTALATSTIATSTIATSAMAADMPVKARPAPMPAPVYTWTGCYIGGNVGWAQESVHFDDSDGFDDRRSRSGVAAGGQIGCDYQFASNWMFGVQGMIDATDIKRRRFGAVDSDFSFDHDARWFATVTARLGFLVTPSALLYAKGGWGTVKERSRVFDGDTELVLSSVNRNASGADVGVGLEWMFTPNWTFFVEWDHIFLDHNSIHMDETSFANIHRDFDKVLFGINWRFGGARY